MQRHEISHHTHAHHPVAAPLSDASVARLLDRLDPVPGGRALDAGPDEFPDLAGLVDLAVEHGYEVVHGHVSTLEEWDEYEWSWTGSLADWALADGRDPGDRAEALEASRSHREAWLRGYRGVLGFATLVLTDARGAGVS